jgi:hypothetical protein
MPGVSGAGVLNLSQIVNWDTEHLEAAARDWSVAAEQWEDHFTSVHRATLAPGGTVWEGRAAEAAQERTFADLVKVRGLADVLQHAAAAARHEADQLDFAKRRVLDAVSEAEEAGFTVAEDLSVTSRQPSSDLLEQARRLALAKCHAAAITARAAELSALDKDAAAKITTSSAPLSEITFAESPITNAVSDPAPANPVSWVGTPPEDNPVPEFINFPNIPQMSIKCIDIRMFEIPGMNYRCFIYHDNGSLEVFLSP